MAKYKGRDIMFTVNGTVIAACKSCDVSIDSETIETTSPTTGDWKTFIAGMKSWSLSANTILGSEPLSSNILAVGNVVTIKIGKLNRSTGLIGESVSGTAIVSKFSIKANVKDVAYGDFKFKGTGALS